VTGSESASRAPPVHRAPARPSRQSRLWMGESIKRSLRSVAADGQWRAIHRRLAGRGAVQACRQAPPLTGLRHGRRGRHSYLCVPMIANRPLAFESPPFRRSACPTISISRACKPLRRLRSASALSSSRIRERARERACERARALSRAWPWRGCAAQPHCCSIAFAVEARSMAVLDEKGRRGAEHG
jgi:hypothetical protein